MGIGILIGADGTLSYPRILFHRFPGYAFIVAETVRRWRFDPARLDGEPVSTHYNLLITWYGRR